MNRKDPKEEQDVGVPLQQLGGSCMAAGCGISMLTLLGFVLLPFVLGC